MKVFILLLTLANASLFAADPVCVRNYHSKQGGGSNCDFSSAYKYVRAMEAPDLPVCARNYTMERCNNIKEYVKINSVDDGEVCVMNFNQPPVANLCESTPQYYDYVSKDG